MSLEQSNPTGNRIPGWEDVHTGKLAAQLDLNVYHVRQILAGKRFFGHLQRFVEIAKALEMDMDELTHRIYRSRRMRYQKLRTREAQR